MCLCVCGALVHVVKCSWTCRFCCAYLSITSCVLIRLILAIMPFKRKERDSNGSEDWWFASIGVPLLAATIGPFANVLSIAALVSYWREDLSDGSGSTPLSQLFGNSIKDPHWATGINVASLVAGYAGNFFLFCNFTQRIRYLVALPATIILWFIASLFVSTETGRSQT